MVMSAVGGTSGQQGQTGTSTQVGITAQNDGMKDSTNANNFANAMKQNDMHAAQDDNDKAHGTPGGESNESYDTNNIAIDNKNMENDKNNPGNLKKDHDKLLQDDKTAKADAPDHKNEMQAVGGKST
jgi:hypothetical protein